MRIRNLHGGRPGRPPYTPGRRRWVLSALFVLAAWSVGALAADYHEDIPVRKWTWDQIREFADGPERIERELFRQGEYDRRWKAIHQMIGDRHVSRRTPVLKSKSGDGFGFARAADSGPDTLDVLIIRIAFEENRDPQLTTVDPSGDFLLEPDPNPPAIPVDPPPRDKAFFEAHLAGLSEYYDYQSGGRLHIAGRVLPEGDQDSYKLSDIADYGPGAGNFWSIESLEVFVRDMIAKADQETQADGSVNLADYGDGVDNAYIIFVHAGSDWQSDINGDSPNDIPTFFVTLGEPEPLLGTDPAGGAGMLSECSVIPETTNQDGYPGSIAAAFYHEFGHALGLPDVYSTGTGLPTAGIWDLMDSGTNLPVVMGDITAEGDTVVISATGVLPPSLSAWCKDFLGWTVTHELDGSLDEYRLPAVGVPRDQYWIYDGAYGDFDLDYPQVYRAGVSTRDYFLLENRWVPWSPATTPFDSLKFERDDDTGVIQYLAGKRGGQWTNSGFYDYFMPSGGLLVWHVNGDRVASFLDANALNYFGDGLRLVEGDGIQDIGVINSYVLGWFGSYLDPFGGTDLYGNLTGFSELLVEGYPSSRGYDRSYTGLHLEQIESVASQSLSVMSFKGGIDPVLPGFPRELEPVTDAEAGPFGGQGGPRRLDIRSLTPVNLGSGTTQVLIYADRPTADWSGTLYPSKFFAAWSDGTPHWVPLPGQPAGAFEFLGGTLTGPPAVYVRPDGDTEVVWGSSTGNVGAILLPDNTAQPSRSWTTSLTDSLIAGPVPFPVDDETMQWLCAAHPDKLVLLDATGVVIDDSLELTGGAGGTVSDVNLAVLQPEATGTDAVAALADGGWFRIERDDDGNLADAGFHPYDRLPAHTPEWTAGREGDAGYEFRVFDTDGELGAWVLDAGGAVANTEPLGLDEPLVTAPAVADLDGDGRNDLVLATRERILAFKYEGVSVRGFPTRYRDMFPLADSTGIAGPLLVADGDGDGLNDVFLATDGGHLIILGPDGRMKPGMPFRWGDRVGGSMVVGGPGDDRVLWLATEGGITGAPFGRNVFNGRMAGYGLLPTLPAESRSSEWLGPAGSSARLGTVGEARSLGSAAPAAVDMDKVVFYPNPVSGDGVTVRFYSNGSNPAELAVYNLEGELVESARITVTAGEINEHFLALPEVASGVYLARLRFDGPSGSETRTLTLAVEK